MKKIIAAIAAILSIANTANAELDFGWGFKGGLNFATYNSDADDFQARMGQWGVLCRLKFGSFAVQPEIYYARQGVRSLEIMIDDHYDEESWGTGWAYDQEKYRLMLLTDNVQMAIMFKYYLPFGTKCFDVQVGPQFSQRFDYKVSSPSPHGYLLDPVLGIESKYDFARDQNKFTTAINFGVGYDSPSGIGVDFRCSMGLTPVFKNLISDKIRDRVWSISFTYLL